MKLFREALERSREPGDQIYFRPAHSFVPRAWVEAMAEYEWECEESGLCPKAKQAGCYCGAQAGEDWICQALLLDGNVIKASFDEILSALCGDK